MAVPSHASPYGAVPILKVVATDQSRFSTVTVPEAAFATHMGVQSKAVPSGLMPALKVPATGAGERGETVLTTLPPDDGRHCRVPREEERKSMTGADRVH